MAIIRATTPMVFDNTFVARVDLLSSTANCNTCGQYENVYSRTKNTSPNHIFDSVKPTLSHFILTPKVRMILIVVIND